MSSALLPVSAEKATGWSCSGGRGGIVVRGWIMCVKVKADGISSFSHGGAASSSPQASICSLKGVGTKGHFAA